MRYAQIRSIDTTNGEEIGVALFVQGCALHCPGCFNFETWNPKGGKEWTPQVKEKFFKFIDRPFIKRVSLLGGDPFYPANRAEIASLTKEVKQRFPYKKIYLWTGYTLSDLLAQNSPVVNSILEKIDVLIDGPFIEKEKDLTLKLRGSRNQNINERLFNADTGKYEWFIKEDN